MVRPAPAVGRSPPRSPLAPARRRLGAAVGGGLARPPRGRSAGPSPAARRSRRGGAPAALARTRRARPAAAPGRRRGRGTTPPRPPGPRDAVDVDVDGVVCASPAGARPVAGPRATATSHVGPSTVCSSGPSPSASTPSGPNSVSRSAPIASAVTVSRSPTAASITSPADPRLEREPRPVGDHGPARADRLLERRHRSGRRRGARRPGPTPAGWTRRPDRARRRGTRRCPRSR